MITINTQEDIKKNKSKMDSSLYREVQNKFSTIMKGYGNENFEGADSIYPELFSLEDIGPIYILEDKDFKDLNKTAKQIGLNSIKGFSNYEDYSEIHKYIAVEYMFNNEYGVTVYIPKEQITPEFSDISNILVEKSFKKYNKIYE